MLWQYDFTYPWLVGVRIAIITHPAVFSLTGLVAMVFTIYGMHDNLV